jgi:hypothetical protein
VGIVGRTPQELPATDGALEIRGIEQPGKRISLAGFYRVLISLVVVLIVGPVVVFVAMVTRVGAARREQRFTAIRLAGATRLQTAALAATETAAAAIGGTLLGWLGFLAARPVVANHVTLGHGIPIFVEDLTAPIWQMLLVLVAVPVLAWPPPSWPCTGCSSPPWAPACARGAGARRTGGWCPWSPGSWAAGLLLDQPRPGPGEQARDHADRGAAHRGRPLHHLLRRPRHRVLAALAVSALALPLMDVATRHDSARFE